MGLVLPIVCGICTQKFTAPAVADLISTDAGMERLNTILETLHEHVKENHKQEFVATALRATQLQRLLVLMYFTTEDRGAVQLRDYMRYQLWLSLQKHRPGTDAELAGIVDQMGLTQRDKPKVLDVLKQCRDIWCEQGKFQPQPLTPHAQANGKPTLVKP
jgi:hypothetical protein